MEKTNTDQEYIRIISLEDIQPPTPNLVNLKFIDEKGNRYTVKKNEKTKLLEIKRILTKSEQEKLADQDDVDENCDLKKEEEEFLKSSVEKITQIDEPKDDQFTEENDKDKKELNLGNVDLNVDEIKDEWLDKDDVNFQYIEGDNEIAQAIINEILKQKERMQYILINLEKCKIFEVDKDENDKYILNDFKRDFEYNIKNHIDKTISLFKELVYYPRSISHYTTHYEKRKLEFLSQFGEEKERFKYIKKWEIQKTCEETSNVINTALTTLSSILNVKVENSQRLLTHKQKTIFNDAKSSIEYCLKNINLILNKIKHWKKKAYEGT